METGAHLLQAWHRTLRLHGNKRAIIQAADGVTITFRELDARASAWREKHTPEPAAWRGRAVVFTAPNSIAWFEIFLGLLQAGAVVVPLDPGEPSAAQRRIAAALRAAGWWENSHVEKLADPRRYRDPDVCLIKLTSGTTGRPRPLVFTGRQLLADARQVTTTMGIRTGDLNYGLIPLGHSYGLGNLTIPLLAQGVPLVCGSAPLPHAIAADFSRWRPTVFPGVPSMWRALGAAADLTLPGLRLAISAGAPLSPDVARDFATRFGQRVHSFYGSSETGGITYDRTGAGALIGEVGRAMRGVRLKFLTGHRLEVSSAAVVTHGNRRRAGAHGLWIMPDRVSADARGHVTLLGRRDSTVKIAGRRVNLTEVAARIRAVTGVRDVWVGTTPAPDPLIGAAIATELTAVQLREALHGGMAAWKIPKKLVPVASLPQTARGKPDTRALQALVFDGAR
jgi:long-chain acyl-CoA synthetase